MYSSSQFFASSQGASQPPFGAESEAAAKRPRQEEKATCLSVTVRWIEAALDQQRTQGTEELLFCGVAPGMLNMVGVVEDLVAQPMSLEFVVNDGTGRLRVRYFVSEPKPEGLSMIAAGRYVCVVGEMRTAPMVHFGCNSINLVESADQVSYHLIEAAHMALRLQKGPSAEPARAEVAAPAVASAFSQVQTPPVKAAEAPPVKAAEAPVQSNFMRSNGALDGAELRGAILDYLRNEQERGAGPEGVALAALSAHLSSTPAADVRKGIDVLVADGEVFSTLDDEHFSVI